MTREEEIKQAAVQISRKHMGTSLSFGIKCAQWADEHPNNPWRDAEKELPKKTRELELLKDEHDKVVIVRKRIGDVVTAYLDAEEIWRLYPTGRVFYGTITHWMPIPQLNQAEQLIQGLQEMKDRFEKGGKQ